MARALLLAPLDSAARSASVDDLGSEGAGFEIVPEDPPGRSPANVNDSGALDTGDGAALRSLPEKFLPSLRLNEWVTQSFHEELQVSGKNVKMTVLIDLRWVRGRGHLTGIQFRDPRVLMEGEPRAVMLRGLQVVFNARLLAEIETYRELNLVVPAGEMVSLPRETTYPLVLVPVAREGNFMGIRLRGLATVAAGAEIQIAQNRGL